MTDKSQDTRSIPAVGRLLETDSWRDMAARYGREQVAAILREIIAEWRGRIVAGTPPPGKWDFLLDEAARMLRGPYTPVINATGILIHTHLGRSPLPVPPPGLMDGYLNLEMDPATGDRGDRNDMVAHLLRRLTGSPAALVVNNNAAAMLLLLSASCRDREVIVSRGELVEIGAGFRVPDILAASGAKLVEVGTTNRTHLTDYHAAIGDRTAAILRTHTSNYRIVGFTCSPETSSIARLAHEHGLSFFIDQGSGAVGDLTPYGIRDEEAVRDLVSSGADAVCFSGDKLLGGPQAGITAGSEAVITAMKSHPLYRALRPGKETLVPLSVTLQAHLQGDPTALPLYEMASRTIRALRATARRIVRDARTDAVELNVVDDPARFGGGTTPVGDLPSVAVEIRCGHAGPDELYRLLLSGRPPIIAARRDGAVRLNMRTIFRRDVPRIVEALRAIGETVITGPP